MNMTNNDKLVSTLVQATTLFCCGLATGTTFYISAVEVPGRADEHVDYQLHNYHQIFPRAAGLMKPFGMVILALCGGCYFDSKDPLWGIPALAFGGLGPFTMAFIVPTNDFLMAAKKGTDKDVKEKLQGWGKLHKIRTYMSCAGFMGAIAAVMA